MKYTVKPYMKDAWGIKFDPVPNPHWKCITCGRIKRSEIYIIKWAEGSYKTESGYQVVHEYACSTICADMYILSQI